MKKLLWLDDARNPFLDLEGKVPKKSGEIHWVLNYEQFCLWLQKFGVPDIVSFDHDLADEHYVIGNNSKEKTGKDCAEYLCDFCLTNRIKLPTCYVHSANPVGAENIISYLKNYKKHCE